MEQYSKTADSKDRGMTLLELELFVMTAKQAGCAPGARIMGEVGFSGKQKSIKVVNNHSPKRHRIKT